MGLVKKRPVVVFTGDDFVTAKPAVVYGPSTVVVASSKALEFACRTKSCAPPPVGSGGSGGSSKASGGGSSGQTAYAARRAARAAALANPEAAIDSANAKLSSKFNTGKLTFNGPQRASDVVPGDTLRFKHPKSGSPNAPSGTSHRVEVAKVEKMKYTVKITDTKGNSLQHDSGAMLNVERWEK
jgi:hypothetical protein